MTSQRIEMEKLLNTRDLGGMTGADGRKVIPGKLFRSGHLYFASEKDLQKLEGLIEMSVDFRSNQECTEKPEPQMRGVLYHHIPILDERRAGVERDENSFAEVLKNMLFDANIAKNYMMQTYEGFICNDFSVSQYERFVRLLLQDHSKGILWHCTAGKDRAGFAAVIVQELLGISREDIREDYLFTNACLEPEIQELTKSLGASAGADPETAARAVRYIFGADKDFLTTAYDTIEKNYGSFENYIRGALHITAEDQEKFRKMYLE